MDFVAIDVETANANMASVCQIGIASFQDGEVVTEWVSLVDPEDHFDYPNICIHGIRPEEVAGKPTFPALLADLRKQLDGQIVVCHTHFDRVSLRQACDKYGLSRLDCRWLDSARVTRRTWSELASSGYGLPNVCEHIGYEYSAHDALEDAKAAGMVLQAAIRESGYSVEDWLRRVEVPIGEEVGSRHLNREGNPDGLLYGEVVVFTGALQIPRREAADMAAQLGCAVSDGVTSQTTLLVVGDQDVAKLAGHDKSSKHRKAEALIEKGHPIRILRETDFLEIVESSS